MMSDKKKPSTLIIARMRTGKPEEQEMAPKSELGGEDDDSMAKESAAEELLKAIESKSPKAVAEAFSSLMELCSYGEEEGEESEPVPMEKPQE